MNADDYAARKAQLIAQCDLDRMRLTHAMLVTRQTISPFSAGGMRFIAGSALGFALPLLARARHSAFLRIASVALRAIRVLRRFLRR